MVQYKYGKQPATAVDADRYEEAEKTDSHRINGMPFLPLPLPCSHVLSSCTSPSCPCIPPACSHDVSLFQIPRSALFQERGCFATGRGYCMAKRWSSSWLFHTERMALGAYCGPPSAVLHAIYAAERHVNGFSRSFTLTECRSLCLLWS